MSDVILDVQHLKKYFPAGKKAVLKAVDDVTFQINRGGDPGTGGRIRLRQNHCGTDADADL